MALSLLDYVNNICPTVGQSDSVSQNLCRTYVKNRYRMIYDSRNWKDATDLITGLQAGIDGIITYPTTIDRVVTVRSTGDHILLPITSSSLMEIDPTIFERTGDPLYYRDFSTVTSSNTGTGQPIQSVAHSLRVYPTPTTAVPIILEGKRVFTQLQSDSDTPILRNIDQTLLAFVMGDMLRRQRQYLKAQTVYQEASAALQNMVEAETERSGHQAQVFPYPEPDYLADDLQLIDRTFVGGTVTVPTDTETGTTSLTQGALSDPITFLVAKTSANYLFTSMTVSYTAGIPPQSIFVTTASLQTINGFTVQLNAAPPDTHYQLKWGVQVIGQ